VLGRGLECIRAWLHNHERLSLSYAKVFSFKLRDMAQQRVGTLVFAGLGLARLRRRWALNLASWLGLVFALGVAVSVSLVQIDSSSIGVQRTVSGLGDSGLVQISQYDVNDPTTFDLFVGQTRTVVQQMTGSLLVPGAAFVTAASLIPRSRNGQVIPFDSAAAKPQLGYYEDLPKHVQMVAGAFPNQPQQGGTWQMTVSRNTSVQLGLEIGDVYCISNEYGESICTRIVGVWQPSHPSESWWGFDHALSLTLVAPDEPSYFQMWQVIPDSRSSAYFMFAPLPSAFARNPLSDSLEQLHRLRANYELIVSTGGLLATPLDGALTDYQSRVQAAAFALDLLTAQILLLTLFYVAFSSGHLLEQQRKEIALWRSRGWGRARVFVLLLAEFTIQALLALPVGLLIGAAGATLVMSLTYGTRWVSVTASDLFALWPQICGALGLGLVVLAVRSAAASRQAIAEARRSGSRPELRPWWQWRYVDLLLGLIGLVLLVRIPLVAQLGSAPNTSQGVDPTTLPILGLSIIFLALVATRLLGPAARLTGLASRQVAAALAYWQLSRRPNQHYQLSLLLIFAVALVLFASTFQATQHRNELDRAAYAVGSDLRATFTNASGMPPSRLADDFLRGNQLVEATTTVFRSVGLPGQTALTPVILGVDPYMFGRVAWSRPGLNRQSMDQLLSQLQPPPGDGELRLPAHSSRLALWVMSPGLTANVGAVIEDSSGQSESFDVGDLAYLGWRRLEASIPTHAGAFQDPLFVKQLYVHLPLDESGLPGQRVSPQPGYPTKGTIGLSDLEAAATGSNTFERVTTFDGAGKQTSWYATSSIDGISLGPMRPDPTMLLNGKPSPSVPLDVRKGDVVMRPIPGDMALPAVAPSVTLDRLGISTHQEFSLKVGTATIRVFVAAVADYFPTLYAASGSPTLESDFLVVDRDLMLSQLSFHEEAYSWPNELWIKTTGAADSTLATELLSASALGITELTDRRQLEAVAASDPLLLGLASNLMVGYGAALCLIVAAFGLHFLISARSRQSEYAILDANGLEPRTVQLSLLLEQVLILSFGVVLGAVLGELAAWVVLPGLPFGTSPQETTPPTVVTVDIGLTALALAVIVALGLATGQVLARVARRADLVTQLRLIA